MKVPFDTGTVLEIAILRTPDLQACKMFPIKTGFN
jgi:hypothetical protein